MTQAHGYSDTTLYRRLASVARPYSAHIVGLTLLSALASPLALLLPVPLKIAVDSALGTHPLPSFLDPLIPGASVSQQQALVVAIVLLVVVTLLSQIQEAALSVSATSSACRSPTTTRAGRPTRATASSTTRPRSSGSRSRASSRRCRRSSCWSGWSTSRR
jgi:ATP-binding cassette subfamily B protein